MRVPSYVETSAWSANAYGSTSLRRQRALFFLFFLAYSGLVYAAGRKKNNEKKTHWAREGAVFGYHWTREGALHARHTAKTHTEHERVQFWVPMNTRGALHARHTHRWKFWVKSSQMMSYVGTVKAIYLKWSVCLNFRWNELDLISTIYLKWAGLYIFAPTEPN